MTLDKKDFEGISPELILKLCSPIVYCY